MNVTPPSHAGTLLGFEFGAFGPLTVRRERVRLGLAGRLRLLYASDLHLGHWWTGRVPAQLLAAARDARPDLILLGGDLVDRRCALPALAALVDALAARAVVAAVPGNHDARAGVGEVRAAVLSAGGRWLLDAPLQEPVAVDAAPVSGPSARPRVLCAHYPSVFPEAVAAGYRLVLAGHLHGGQCVWATYRDRLYPAAWFNRWHGLRFIDRGALLLVSLGAGDTLPLRFNCPREVLVCDLD